MAVFFPLAPAVKLQPVTRAFDPAMLAGGGNGGFSDPYVLTRNKKTVAIGSWIDRHDENSMPSSGRPALPTRWEKTTRARRALIRRQPA